MYAVTNAKVGDMYLNTHTCDVFKAANAVQASFDWVLVCNIKGAKGDAANIPRLAIGVAGIVPGTTMIVLTHLDGLMVEITVQVGGVPFQLQEVERLGLFELVKITQDP